MKLLRVKRTTRLEKRYSKRMGMLYTRVTYIKKHVLGIPTKTLHAYRETYYGKIKDCNKCSIQA